MIVAFKHEDMSSRHVGKFYHDLESFARAEFDIKITDEGHILINGDRNSITYILGDGTDNTYTKEEAIHYYCESKQFKAYAKSRFWTAYLIKEKLI